MLTSMQNKCLRMITGAFCTTNIAALEIKASIPPIDLWLEYKIDLEALQILHLAEDHPITCHIYLTREETPLP